MAFPDTPAPHIKYFSSDPQHIQYHHIQRSSLTMRLCKSTRPFGAPTLLSGALVAGCNPSLNTTRPQRQWTVALGLARWKFQCFPQIRHISPGRLGLVSARARNSARSNSSPPLLCSFISTVLPLWWTRRRVRRKKWQGRGRCKFLLTRIWRWQ